MDHPIVLGYDGSTCSAAALDEALALAHDLKDSEILMVYCHEPPPGLACALDPACAAARELRDYESRVEGEVEPLLAAAAAQARGTGVRTEVVMAWDEPVHALIEVAREHGSHIIVVGSHGESALSGALSRNTPYELLHRSTIPVMVVPHRV